MKARPYLEVGYVSKAHGLDGEVGIKTFDPASDVFNEVETVRLRLKDGSEVEYTLDSLRSSSKEVLVGFEGVDRRESAERLVGSTVLVSREDLSPPEEGEFFQGDLVGLSAFDSKGALLGTVEEIWNTGPVPNLVIRAQGKPELVVPFADDFVLDVDLDEGRMTVRPPEFEDAS